MKNKFIIFLLLAIASIGLSACQRQSLQEYSIPTSVEIVNLAGDDTMSIGDDPLELLALVNPSSAKQQVVWSSSNPTVATVGEDGKVTPLAIGITTIGVQVLENTALEDELVMTVVDDPGQLETISGIIQTLDELIPDTITTEMTLPTRLEEATITWESSNYNTINRNGLVVQNRFDQSVEIRGTIKLSRNEGVFQKTIMVKAYSLKDLSNRKVAFTYLFDPNFTEFRSGDLERIDVINYSFGGIQNNQVSINGLQHLNTIIGQAHANGVRVVLAIGGWGVDGFSEACSTSQNRSAFIASIMTTIRTYRFDGIDIDWEYPTSTAGGLIGASPNDRTNLTYFMQDLKIAMNSMDSDLILSMAVAAGTYAANSYYDIQSLSSIIDYLHLMTYDMINYSTFVTTHHTNLYPSNYSTFSVSQAVDLYYGKGMPKSKIVIGVAFYGHVFKTTSAGTNGIGATSDRNEKTTFRYASIVENYLNNPLYTLYTDDVAKASWLYGEGIFVSFDNPASIALKAQYVLDQGLGGLMAWEYCQDDASSSLVRAIYDNAIISSSSK
ncbi:MAG: glycosyl hydrolase family 18 protein [Bacilli bacterium]